MQADREKWAKIRIIMASCLFALCFSGVIARCFFLQIMQHEELVKRAERQHQRTIKISPARGGIFDRTGAELAISLELDSIFADQRQVSHPDKTAAAMADILKVPQRELRKKLSGDRAFVWISRQLPPEQVKKIKELKLAGIGFVKESKRFYPNYETASHALGFTGGDVGGLEGLELRYDATIEGKTGYLMAERDGLGRHLLMKDSIVQEAYPGKNLHLTLDKNIQYFTEKELSRAVQNSRAKTGMAVVMDPWTGKILALANYPAFNPNAYNRAKTFNLRNRCVTDSFEPGSTFKTFLLSAAIEEKLVRPQDTINCENGRYAFGGRLIRDDHPHQYATVSEVLKYSSNVGSAKIGIKLGDERLYRYLRNFGFGEKSGIDLPGETAGSLRPTNRWYGTDIATISFGQGVAANAIQIAAATSAIANGGLLMKPYLVEKITDQDGNQLQLIEPQTVRRVISAETAATVSRIMETVTQKGGTATSAAIDGLRVAGKTGTSQKVDPGTRRYSATRRTASFVGFVPAEKPMVTIFVVIDEPKTSVFGGVVAAPVFREIAFNTLCYLKAAGTAQACSLPKSEPDDDAQLLPVDAETGVPEPVQPVLNVVSTTSGGAMPNFRGMSMRRVLQVMEQENLNLQLRGSGRVIDQHPAPGEQVRSTDQVWVRLSSTI